MAITIDATIAGASANSYNTVAEADTYFEEAVTDVTAWTGASADQKKAALVQAAKRINEPRYDGRIYLETQNLAFPRYAFGYSVVLDSDGTIAIPDDVKNAQLECALWLLKYQDKDIDAEYAMKGGGRVSVGDRSVEVNADSLSPRVGPVAAQMLRKFIRRSGKLYDDTATYANLWQTKSTPNP